MWWHWHVRLDVTFIETHMLVKRVYRYPDGDVEVTSRNLPASEDNVVSTGELIVL